MTDAIHCGECGLRLANGARQITMIIDGRARAAWCCPECGEVMIDMWEVSPA